MSIILQIINIFTNPYILGLLILALVIGTIIIFFQKRQIKNLLKMLEHKEELTEEDEKQIKEARDIIGLNKKIFNFKK